MRWVDFGWANLGWADLAGYLACALVFVTFYMKGMVSLRLVALCSNFVFLVYAFTLHLAPIAILHSALIPVNVVRLIAALRESNVRLAGLGGSSAGRRHRPF